MECACVACHGPIPRGRRPKAVCSKACRSMWVRLRAGVPLSPECQLLRVTHAYRRDLMATMARVQPLAEQAAA